MFVCIFACTVDGRHEKIGTCCGVSDLLRFVQLSYCTLGWNCRTSSWEQVFCVHHIHNHRSLLSMRVVP